MREIVFDKCSYSNGKSRRKLPWFSAQIEDAPIPIDSVTWAGSYDKKRSILRISDNLMITGVLFSYGTDFQKVPNRFLYGENYSDIQADFSGSGYMEGNGMGAGKGLELVEYLLQVINSNKLWNQ